MQNLTVLSLLLVWELSASSLRPVRFSTDTLKEFLAEGDRVAAAVEAQSDPAPTGFRINVVKSQPQNNLKKGRATKAVVEVRDRNNRPVAGAYIIFGMPSSGPGGTFASGTQTFTVATNSAGQATVTYTPNQLAGMFNIEVTAQVNGATVATSTIPQANLAAAAAAAGISGTTIGVIAGVAAAAAVGIGVGLSGSDSSPTPTPVTPPPAPPSIRIGPGGNPVFTPQIFRGRIR